MYWEAKVYDECKKKGEAVASEMIVYVDNRLHHKIRQHLELVVTGLVFQKRKWRRSHYLI